MYPEDVFTSFHIFPLSFHLVYLASTWTIHLCWPPYGSSLFFLRRLQLDVQTLVKSDSLHCKVVSNWYITVYYCVVWIPSILQKFPCPHNSLSAIRNSFLNIQFPPQEKQTVPKASVTCGNTFNVSTCLSQSFRQQHVSHINFSQFSVPLCTCNVGVIITWGKAKQAECLLKWNVHTSNAQVCTSNHLRDD
jgi:hypothetical protein